MDGDGTVDLLAGNYWFKHVGGDTFHAHQGWNDRRPNPAGRFKPGKYPQIVIAPGDGIGPLKMYECTGNPEREADWSAAI